VKSFKETVFLSKQNRMFCGVKSYNKCSKCSHLASIQVHNRFATSLLPCQ